ncbi:MAG: hypothetical protein E7048_10525 [Lentisphaerae bacterium]|nr:hypothetical protein [Lentisphaerota bacterium]
MGNALIFCGIKHCGKSTLGKTAAQQLQRPFYDTDLLMEEKSGTSVRELFKTLGEDEFRRFESALIRELPVGECVISLGGGALLKEENHAPLQKLGTLIWCDISDEIAFERISRNGLPPFLAEASDPFDEFCRRNRSRRETFSRVCQVRFSPSALKTPAENVGDLFELLKTKGILTL